MSSLISNIRKASAPLTESSAHLGRLLLQLGQAADSALDAETLAELDKQATLAACQAIEAENARAAAAAAAGDGDGDGGGGGGDAGTKEASGSGGGDNSTGGDGTSATEESGGLHEESSTATTVELSVDSSQHAGGEIGSNNSSSHHHQPPPVGSQAGGGSDPVAIATAASTITTPRSLMQASSVHSNTSSHAAPSPSSSLHGPNKNTGGGAAASEPSTLPSADHGGEAAAGTPKESPSSQPEAAPSERKSSADGPVTVVLHGFDTEADEKLVVCESRALAHLFTRIRNRDTPPPTFRFYASRLLRILAEEGIACLESSRQFITTPTAATFSSVFVDESNVCVVSILRAGDALAEAAQACLPSAPAGKILIQRDEESRDKHPVLFYKKLPPKIATMQVLLCDPMLATGGSALMAIRCLVESGVKESAVVFVTVVVCPEGLGAVRAEFPEVTIVTGAIDDCLDERRYILPGLGDFGDRFFGTVA